jgi:hypothetical protein
MPFYLDTNLNHPDISNNWSTFEKCIQYRSNRIMGESHEVGHTEIPDSD